MTCEQVNFVALVQDHLMAVNNKIQQAQATMLHNRHLDNSYQHNNQHKNPPPEFHHQNYKSEQQALDGFMMNNSAPSAEAAPEVPSPISNSYGQHEQDERKEEEKVVAQVGAPAPAPTTKDNQADDEDASTLSTITILRRHPMYDSLVLVKKYRPCLDGYILEFPTSAHAVNSQATKSNSEPVAPSQSPTRRLSTENDCILGKAYDVGNGRTKLVSVYLDGDDPIYQHNLKQQNGAAAANGANPNGADQQDNGEVVYVPVNGLLHRLNNYDRQGIAIDSRVYAFAMGLKTAERFLTSSTEKEVQEAPPL